MRDDLSDPLIMPSFEEFTEMIRPIWDSAWLTNMGDYHKELERRLKEYMGTENLVLFVTATWPWRWRSRHWILRER